MDKTLLSGERPQTYREEIANSLTHGIALVAVLVASPFLIIHAYNSGDSFEIVGASIFSATMVIVYLTSTLYHSMPFGRAKHVLRVIDHGAIFLLIAGTYTPFTLGAMRGEWGIILLVLEWILAISGILLKAFTGVRYRKLSISLYLVMGWLVVIAIRPFIESITIQGIFWVLAGGFAYTFGIPFYAAKDRKYTHLVWHLFVILGTVCHFIAVMWYA